VSGEIQGKEWRPPLPSGRQLYEKGAFGSSLTAIADLFTYTFDFFLLFLRTKCINGYKGKYCDVKFCEPRDDAKGHYNCTKDNDKVCLPGWIDPSTNCVMRQVAPSSSTIKTEYSTSIQPSLIIPTKSLTQQTQTSTALKQIFTTTEPVHTTKKTKTAIKTDLPTKQHTTKANQNTGHPTEPYTTTKIYLDSTSTEKHLQPTESSQVGKTNTAGNKDKPNRIFEIVFTTLIVVLIALLAFAVIVRKRLIQRNKVHSPDINQMVSKYSENESESTSSLAHEENNNIKSSTTLT
uniref:DSL domain-containing protein n=1 Tax=Clytia hemisphaerica TaxID=252671 RepID=A0A7M5UKE6_9CNID